MEMVKAIIQAAEEQKAPVMIQTTPSTVKYGTLETYQAIVAAEAAKAEAAKADSENTSKTTEDTTEDSSEDSGDNYYKDGTYTGSGQGFGGTIEVQVTLKDDEITDIQVTSASGEDSAYLSQGEGVISSIISAQSTDVDTISGATFSSTGILNAVNDALGKAENQ